MNHEAFCFHLDTALAEIRKLLVTKNLAYGNSALEPIRYFSTEDALAQIKVRLDDKLSRILRGERNSKDLIPENTLLDMVGYYFLRRAAELNEGKDCDPCQQNISQMLNSRADVDADSVSRRLPYSTRSKNSAQTSAFTPATTPPSTSTPGADAPPTTEQSAGSQTPNTSSDMPPMCELTVLTQLPCGCTQTASRLLPMAELEATLRSLILM